MLSSPRHRAWATSLAHIIAREPGGESARHLAPEDRQDSTRHSQLLPFVPTPFRYKLNIVVRSPIAGLFAGT